MSQSEPDEFGGSDSVDYPKYEKQSEQEEYSEAVSLDLNLRRDLHKLSETVDELRYQISALEFSGRQVRCMLSYHKILISSEKMKNDETKAKWSTLDSDSNQYSSTLGNSEHLAVRRRGEVLFSEELNSELNLGQLQSEDSRPYTDEDYIE